MKVGDRVTINNDNWSDVNKTAHIVEVDVFRNRCIVESEDGVTMTLALHQVIPQDFLSE